MNSLFYHFDIDSITFLWLYSDGSAVAIGKPNRINRDLSNYQLPIVRHEEVSHKSGTYQIRNDGKISVKLTGEAGSKIFHGYIFNENALKLVWRCEYTLQIKVKTFHRYSEANIFHFFRQAKVGLPMTPNLFLIEMNQNYGLN